MTAVVAGEGLGLLNTSMSQLNGAGAFGQPKVGNGVDGLFINVVNGNVVFQGQDDYVTSVGFDVAALRVYNSQGLMDDDNGDNWSLGFHRRLISPPATGQADVTLVAADGHRTVFHYSGTTLLNGVSVDTWTSTDGAGAHDTLKRVSGQWIYEEPSAGLFDTYDATGRLLSTADRDGNTLTYAYNGNLLSSVTDASGQVTNCVYSGTKLTQVSVTGQSGTAVRVRYSYDASNRLEKVKVDLLNPGDQSADSAANTYTTTYTYDGTSKRIASITQSDGSSVLLEYVQVGADYRIAKLTTSVGASGSARVTTFNYDIAARRTDVTDPQGGLTRYSYDDENRLIRVEAPAVSGVRSVSDYSYDTAGNITQVSTRVGSNETRTIRYQYDTNGNLIEVQDALGNTQRRTYNGAGQLLTETAYLTPDPDGSGTAGQPSQPLTTNYIYDGEQHLRFLVSPEGRVTEYRYNGIGQQTDVIQYNGSKYGGSTYTEPTLSSWSSGLSDKTKAQRTYYTYDFRGQMSSATRYGMLDANGEGVNDANASTTYFVYDPAGRLLQTIDPRGSQSGAPGQTYVTSFTYDGLGRLRTATDNTGQITTTAYQAATNQVVSTSPQGLVTTRVYNLAGELIEQTQSKSTSNTASGTLAATTTKYEYDDLGRLRVVTDPVGLRSYVLYDARGWKVADIGAEGSLTEYFYNDAGQVTGIRRYSTPLTEAQLAMLVDANGKPTNTGIDAVLGRTPTGTNNAPPQLDLNGASAGNDYAATVSSSSISAAVDSANLTLNAGGDGTTLYSATAIILNPPNGASELLSIASGSLPSGMTATYDNTRNLLTIRDNGNAARPMADFQTALRGLRYQNTATTPIQGQRHIQIVVNDGKDYSTVATSRLLVGTPPTLDLNGAAAGTSYSATYTENASAVAIVDSSALTVTDIDSSNLNGATARIINLLDPGLETLSVSVGSTGITASYNSSTGVLTLSGNKSAASYQTVLRTLKFRNTSENPTTTARTVEVSISDGDFTSNIATTTVSVVSVNDAATVSGASTTATYTEDTAPVVVVNAGLTLSDVDNANLIGATITLTSRPNGSAEVLSVDVGSTGITASYNSSTGVLTLSGSSTVADYQTVLRTLKYQNSSQNPTEGIRSINLVVSDGTANSAASTTTVNVVAVNDAPTISNGSATATYTEDAVPVVVNAGLILTDVDNTTLSGATVTLTSRPNGSSEVLSVDVGGTGITASYDENAGVLTLSGSSSVTNYQAVLRTLKYQNTSQNPIEGDRSISIVVNDGVSDSPAVATAVGVVPVNDSPTLGGVTASVAYNEDDMPVLFAAGALLDDVDSPSLSGATVTLGSRADGSSEILSIDVGSTGIVASYNASTGVLTLSGSGSIANYQAVLRTLKYQNTSQNPTAGSRSISLVVNDGTANSAAANTTVTVVPVNDAPTISNAATTATYTEDATAVVVVNAGLTLADLDNTSLTGATISLSSRPNGTAEVLSIDVGSSGIAASYDGSTGVLTLSGTSSVANYQAVLRTLKYQNTSQNPTAGNRSISLVVNDGAVNSAPANTTVTVVPVNDAPTISNAATTATYTEDATPVVVVNTGLTLADVDNANLAGATITLTSRPNTTDELLSVDVGSTGILASYNATTGVLTLSGSKSRGSYQTVLRTLKYQNTSQNPTAGSRSISLVVNDGAANSAAATTTVNVVPVNDVATISSAAMEATYTEDAAPAVVVDAGLTLSDVDNVNLTGATVTLSDRPDGNSEILSLDVGSSGIVASYNSSTGILTLSGSSAVANYQAVLRSLKYQNTSQNPTAGSRSISLVVNDGTADSAAATTSVNVVPVNDLAIIANAQSSPTPSYVEDAAATVIVSSSLTLSDVDSTTLVGATVTLASRPNGSSERLSVDTSGTGISASYNSSTGVLTLSGSSGIANYQTVLRTLKYWNTSQNPTGGSRSVNLVVNDGVAGSSPVLVTFNVTPVNDAPTLSGATSSLTYTEDAGSVLIEQSLALADVDNANLAGATILLNSLPDGGAESLSVDLGSTGIVASYSNGLLTLSGISSVSNYQVVLRSLRYLNSSQNPTAGPRAVTISVSDGALDSNSVTTTINVVAVNDLTVIGNGSSGLSYTEDSPAIAINPGLTLSDVDSTQIIGARIRLVSNPDGAQEFFSGINAGTTGIVYAYDSVSGYWNLTGTASLAEYQQVLRTITYLNTSQNPTAGARAIELAVNDGSDWSEILQTVITVVPINDAPYIDLSPSDPSKQSGSVVFPLLGNSVQCLPDVIVSDVDNATLASALAVIQSPTGMDSLSVNTAGTSITAFYQSSSGTLSLVGAATVAEYRQVLKTLTYTYSLGGALFLSNKRINISVSDGQLSSYANTLTILTPALGALQGGSSSSSTQTSSIQSVGDSSPVMAAAFIGTPITSGADRLEQRIYDAAGRLVFVVVDDVDGAGTRVRYVTETKYDGASRVIKTIAYANPLTLSLTGDLTEANVRSNLTSIANSSNDRAVQSIYDKDGLLLGMVDAEGGFTEIRYDAAGRQTQSIRYGKKVTYTGTQSISTLVGQGTPTSDELSADPSLAPQNSYTLYNNKGQIAGQIDSEGYLTAFEYDSVGNKRFGIRYGGKVSYTGLENLASLTAMAIASTPSGTTATRTHEWQYDALNRVIQEIDEQGTITAYNYHPQSGFLTSVTRASGSDNERTTTNRYDALGRLTESINGIGSAALAAAGTTTAQNNVWSKYRTRNSYDLAGRLVKTTAPSSVDSAGNAVSHYIVYFYDRQNRLQYTVNASGEVKGYTYNAFGDLESITEYANRIGNPGALTGGDAGTLIPPVSGNDRVTGTTYTLRGQVDVVTDTLGFSANSDYNAFGELAKKVWDVGETVGSSLRTDTWSYDRRGLVKDAYRDTTGTGALNYKDSYTYDVFGRQITHTDARLSVWRTGYDKLGRVVTTTDALGGGTVTGYDAFSRVLTRTDRLGNTTTYAYDDLDRSTTVTTPEGVVTKAVSNRHGQQISITLTNLNQPETTTYTYDLDGRLKTVTKPSTLGSQGQSNTESTVNGYDDSGLLTSVTDGRGIVTTYTYDATSRVVTRTIDKGTGLNTFTNQNYLNLITRYQYDAFGNSIRVADARGIITETVFDRRGKSVAVIVDTTGLKLATEYKYDAEGRAVLVREGIQATGASGDLNIPGTWDYSGAALKTTQYVFDDLGRRKQEILDPGVGHLNITTSYDYDKAGNLTRKKDPRTDQAIYTWYTYDANNRLVHTVDALGGVTKNSYDAEARVTSVTQYATPISVTGFGAVVSATSVNPPVNTATDRTTTTIYDKDGRVIYAVDARLGLTKSSYDAAGRIKLSTRYAMALGSGVVLTRAGIDSAIAAAGFMNLQADQTTEYDYDAAGRLTKLTDAIGFYEEYGYDKAGNRISLKNKMGDEWTYVYDSVGRLYEERGPQAEIYSINASGTPLLSSPLLAFKATQFDYDEIGNLLARREGYKTALNGAFTSLRATQYRYDGRGLQTRTILPTVDVYNAAADKNNAYGANDALSASGRTESTPEGGLQTLTWYDNAGRAVASRDASGRYTYKSYDAVGRLKYEVDAERAVTVYGYDAVGNLTSLRRLSIVVDQSAMDGSGQSLLSKELAASGAVVDSTDQRAKALAAQAWAIDRSVSLNDLDTDVREVSTTYDRLNRKDLIKLPGIDYLLTGVPNSADTLQRQPTTDYDYNAFGEVTTQKELRDPVKNLWITTYFGYDQAGNQTHKVDALGYYTKNGYDAFGRLMRSHEYAQALSSIPASLPNFTTFSAPTPRTPSTSGAVANPSSGYDRIKNIRYDQMDRVIEEELENVQYSRHDSSDGSVDWVVGDILNRSMSYDALGNVIASTDASGANTRTYYDKLGRVIAIVQPSRVSPSIDGNSGGIRSIDFDVSYTSRLLETEYNTSYYSYQTTAKWSSLASWGDGRIRATVSVSGQSPREAILAPGATTWTFQSSGTKTNGSGSSGSFSNFEVQKEVFVNGVSQWVTVYSNSTTAPRFELLGATTATTARLCYRKGSGPVTSVVLTKLGASWVASIPALVQGSDYSYEFYATTNGTERLVSSGPFAVATPAGQEISVQGTSNSEITPTTEMFYDALGNQIASTRYAGGSIAVNATNYSLVGANAQDQTSFMRYDALGRLIESIDAAGKSEYRSYDAKGNVRKVWQRQTDLQGISRWKAMVYDYDSVGRQLSSTEIVRSPVDAESGYVLYKTGATFNTFGEQVSKGTKRVSLITDSVDIEESASYDKAGRLWKMTSGGATKLYQYDLQGNLTAEVLIPSTTTVGNPSQIAGAIGAQRTEYVRDELGRVTEKREPSVTSDTRTAAGMDPAQLGSRKSASVSSMIGTMGPQYWERGEPYRDTKYVLDVAWDSIAGYGTGAVQLTVYYREANDSGTIENKSAIQVLSSGDVGGQISFTAFKNAEVTGVTRITVERYTGTAWIMARDSTAAAALELLTPRGLGESLASNSFKYWPVNNPSAIVTPTMTTRGRSAYSFTPPTAGTYDYQFTINQSSSSILTVPAAYETYTGRFTVDANGKITSVTRPEVSTTTTRSVSQQTVDRWGNVLTTIDPRNGSWITYYDYDHNNQVLRMEQPTITVWDEQATSANAAPATTYQYDIRGNLIAEINPNGAIKRRFYDAAGQLIEERDALSGVIRHVYDGLSRETRTVQANGRTIDKGYDKLDRLVWQENLGYSTDARYDYFAYDELGNRIIQKTGVGGHGADAPGSSGELTRYQYDTRGQLVQMLLPQANIATLTSAANKTTYTYDENGRKIGETDGLGNKQEWIYDQLTGQLLKSKDLAGVESTYTYDPYGRRAAMSNSSISETPIGYSQAAARTTHGQSLEYKYYDDGRLKSVRDVLGGVLSYYEYDLAGNRVLERTINEATKNPDQDTRLMYDALGRLIRATDALYRIDYAYDAVGNRRATFSQYYDTLSGSTVKSVEYWYKYDANNRIVLSQGVKSTGSNGVIDAKTGASLAAGEIGITTAQGIWMEYDDGSNRTKTIQYEKNGSSDVLATRRHTYEASNLIANSYYQTASISERITSGREYTAQGRLYDYRDYGSTGGSMSSRRTMSYDSNGRLLHQDYYNGNFSTVNVVIDYKDTSTNASWYDGAGNLLKYQVKGVTGNAYTQTYEYAYLRFGASYKQAYIYGSGQADQGGFTPGSTYTSYDRNGNITFVSQTGQTTRTFITDQNGQILKKNQNGYSQLYAYANGMPIGTFSLDPGIKADFDYNYTPVSDSYPPSTPGQYVTQAGDTLQKVAYSVYGDASLWYLIADANGLTGSDPLPAGMSLNIPNQITNLRNANDTFKPYSPGEIIGDTSPELKFTPPPPPKLKCGVLATIISVVVTAIVTYITHNPALGAMAGDNARQTTLAVTNGYFDWSKFFLTTAATGSPGIGAIAANENYDYASTAIAGAAAYVGGEVLGATTNWGGAASAVAGSVAGNVTSQALNIALGRQKGFSWISVAASAAASVVGQQTKSGLNSLGFSDGFARIAATAANGLTQQAVTILMEGHGRIDLVSIAIDAFGNALGNSIVGQIKFSAEVEKLGKSGKEQYDWARANGKSADEALAQGRYRDQQDMRSFFAGGASSPSAFTGESYEVAGGSSRLGLRDGSGITTYAMGERPELGAPTPIAPVPMTDAQRADYESRFGPYQPLDLRAAERQLASEMYALPGAIRDGLQQNLVEFGSRSGPIGSTVAGLTYSGLSVAIPFDTYGGAAAGVVGGEVLGSIARIPAVSRILNTDLGALAGNVRQAGANFFGDLLTGPTAGSMAAQRGSLSLELLSSGGGRGIVSDVYSPDFIGPVKFESFYRGDSTLRTSFLSSKAELEGIPQAQTFLSSLDDASFRIRATNHSFGSEGSVFLSVTKDPQVAEYFARGSGQNQLGFVTEFRVPSGNAAADFATYNRFSEFNSSINPSIGLREQEWLAPVRIDPRYIFSQNQVSPQ